LHQWIWFGSGLSSGSLVVESLNLVVKFFGVGFEVKWFGGRECVVSALDVIEWGCVLWSNVTVFTAVFVTAKILLWMHRQSSLLHCGLSRFCLPALPLVFASSEVL